MIASAPTTVAQPYEPSLLLRKHGVALRLALIDADSDDKATAAAVRAVGRLIQDGRLRAVRIAGRDLVAPAELVAMVERETAAGRLANGVAVDR